MSDEPEKLQNLPGRHRPNLSNLSKETTEEDLWDFDDDPTESPPSTPNEEEPPPKMANAAAENEPVSGKKITTKPRSKPKRAAAPEDELGESEEEPVLLVEEDNLHTPRSVDPGTRPTPPKASRPNGPRPLDPSGTESPGNEAEPAPSKASESSEPEAQTERQPKKSEPEKPSTRTPVGKHEMIGLIILGVVFLGLATWWISGLFSSIATSRIGDDQPDFPAKGSFITIDTAETYWREPIRDGERPDVARREVEFLPVLRVTIEESGNGVLRAIFRNDEGDFVGDSISQPFGSGMFDLNGNPVIEFPATDGFTEAGEFNGYRVGDDRWTVEVFEGPSVDAPGSEFKLLFTAPISSNRQ